MRCTKLPDIFGPPKGRLDITVFSNFPKIYWIKESFSKHGYEELTFFKVRFVGRGGGALAALAPQLLK